MPVGFGTHSACLWDLKPKGISKNGGRHAEFIGAENPQTKGSAMNIPLNTQDAAAAWPLAGKASLVAAPITGIALAVDGGWTAH
jgi:hypothetical protein